MTHYRWKHRSVTLLLALLILVGLLCPAYAIKSTYETGWPVLGTFSEGNISGSYYNLTTAITCAEYPADGDISRAKYNSDDNVGFYFKQFENIKVVEIPGLNAATAKREDYSLTLSVTHIYKKTVNEVETITLPKTNYYYPVRVELAAQDGRRCPVYIVAVPAKRDYTQADFSKAVKLHYDLLPKITSLYNTLNETEVGVAGGYHKESSNALSIYCNSMGAVGLQFDDSIANNPSAEWVQEWTLNRLRSCNILSPEQAAYCLSHTMPEIMEYCSQTIANAELRGLRAANTQCISTGEKEYTLTLPAGTDWNKIKGALEFDTIGECVTSASGSWGSGRNVFLTLSAKDIATGLVYNSTQNGIVQNTYTLKLKTGAPVFSVSSFKIGGRTADITEAADGTNTISLHLAKDWSWTQKPDITYTGTGYAFLDENGNEVAAGADGKIDFSKAKTLHLTLDLSTYAASGVFADTMKFTKDYALNITQGNSDACELLSFSVGAAEEQVVLDGTNITVTIPYATKWDRKSPRHPLLRRAKRRGRDRARGLCRCSKAGFVYGLAYILKLKTKTEKRRNMNDTITEINKDTFWGLIREARDACGQDMSAMVEHLKGRLVSMGAEQAQSFHDITQAYEDLAYKYGLWDAAEIIKEYGCSDDGFIDFRAWLIAQGKEVYLAALADPDSLAEVEPYGDCSFELMSYVGEYAYKQLTGKSTYEQTEQRKYKKLVSELKRDITYKDGIQFPREGAELKQFLPQLCAKYPDRWLEPHWIFDLKVARELFHAGKVHDHQQVCKKRNRGHGGEAR